MNIDKRISENANSAVNVIVARFLIAVFGVVGLVTVLTFTGVFLTTRRQVLIMLLAALPGAVCGFRVLLLEHSRNNTGSKYVLCTLMCIQAIAVSMAAYSYAGTIVLLLPVLLSSLYPKSRVSSVVSAVMIVSGLIIPPLALMLGLWDGEYYEFLYDLSFAREMDTATLSSVMLTWQNQIDYAIRFCSSQNILIVGGFTVIGRLIYRQTNQSFDSQREVHRLSETDILTGLLNRNCYERRMEEITSSGFLLPACFYFDVNGLHEMNNTQGHKAGDVMLWSVGKTIQKVFGEDNSFRIGGDEYVAFVMNTNREELSDIRNSLKEEFEAQGYHVAIGYARNDSAVSANDLIQRAEKEMYRTKNEYYSIHGNSRVTTSSDPCVSEN